MHIFIYLYKLFKNTSQIFLQAPFLLMDEEGATNLLTLKSTSK